ncbi:MAG TPA: HD domain-containing protein, partial [Candidatus Obscuribacterales bacterium]
KEHADQPIDELYTIKMALIHDLVEIDAGDTYCYDEAGHDDTSAREVEAAKRIFSMLPDEQGKEIWQLWQEFEEGKTAEARFARAIDRINPFMLNYYSGGGTWRENGITRTQVMGRMGEIQANAPKLWPYVTMLIEGAIEKGWVKNL